MQIIVIKDSFTLRSLARTGDLLRYLAVRGLLPIHAVHSVS